MEIAVEFDSDLFTPYLPEDSQVNPHVYGAELAFWLSRTLAGQNIYTSYPLAEDWGWFIEYITAAGDEYWLCCTNRDQATNKWRCFIDAKAKSLFGRNRAQLANAKPLLNAFRAILEATPEITHITWEPNLRSVG